MRTEKLMRAVSQKPNLTRALKLYCHFVSALTVAAFGLCLYFYAKISLLQAAKYLLTLGIPFVVVSLARRFFSAPRPYEIFDFYKEKPKSSEKNSFPSRHAFSVFAISVLMIFVYPIIGSLLFVLGISLCLARLAVGYHFLRDLICGGVIGIISSLIGALVLM